MERIGVALEEAVRIIEESICPVQNTEAAAVEAADGRILAEDVYASMDQPPFPRSPLDGFAFRSSDVEDACEAAPAVLRVNQIIYAGEWWKTSVGPGQAARIMTGAPMPGRSGLCHPPGGDQLGRGRKRGGRLYRLPGQDFSPNEAISELLLSGRRCKERNPAA